MVLISVQTSIISPLGNGHDLPLAPVSLLQRRTQRRCPKRPCVCVTPLLTKPQAPQEALPDLVPADLSDHLAAVSPDFHLCCGGCAIPEQPSVFSPLGRLPSPQVPVRLSHPFLISLLDFSRKPSLTSSI